MARLCREGRWDSGKPWGRSRPTLEWGPGLACPGLPPAMSHTLSSGDILKRVIFHPVGFYRRLLLEAFQKEVNIPEVDIIFLPDTSSSVNSFASKHKAQMLKTQPIPYLPDISIRIRKTWVQILLLSLTDWVILNSLTFSEVCFLYLCIWPILGSLSAC